MTMIGYVYFSQDKMLKHLVSGHLFYTVLVYISLVPMIQLAPVVSVNWQMVTDMFVLYSVL